MCFTKIFPFYFEVIFDDQAFLFMLPKLFTGTKF